LKDEVVGEQAQKLFDDAQAMLKKLVDGNEALRKATYAAEHDKRRKGEAPARPAIATLEAKGVYGLFPASSIGDDIELYDDLERNKVIATIHTLRQQMQRNTTDGANLALADFVAPKTRGVMDYVGAFTVAIFGGRELAENYKQQGDDYNAIMVEALADRLAEAFAERLHARARGDMGYGKHEKLGNEELIAEKYRGIRPAPGYPACPDHTEKATIWKLLGVKRRIGATLTENYAMQPGSAVSGWYFFGEHARYFGLGKIGRDQLEDYAKRKGWTMDQAERWLRPNLQS
jgi:5-methyltetrahydrofolate--homocysteine methyltransferase